jgi:hypothetical protein
MSSQLGLALGEETTEPARVWETLPLATRAQVTVALARLLARLVEEGRDE